MKEMYGFSLLEMLVVVAIIGILAAVTYPTYQDYMVKTNRTDMMNELQNSAKLIESRKLAAGRGGYAKVNVADLQGNYPKDGNAVYRVTIDLGNQQAGTLGQWVMTAEPISGTIQDKDGDLTLSYNGNKCRKPKTGNRCGMGDEWRN